MQKLLVIISATWKSCCQNSVISWDHHVMCQLQQLITETWAMKHVLYNWHYMMDGAVRGNCLEHVGLGRIYFLCFLCD